LKEKKKDLKPAEKEELTKFYQSQLIDVMFGQLAAIKQMSASELDNELVNEGIMKDL
jgi:hypothetical protein